MVHPILTHYKQRAIISGVGIARGLRFDRHHLGHIAVKNVLILDSDLGFVFWLGQFLDAAGYDTLPAKGVREAASLLAELHVRIDLLMVRCSLSGADVFAEQLRWSQHGHLRTIGLIDEDDERSGSMGTWDAWQLKPNLPNTNASEMFLSLVETILKNGTKVPTAQS